MHCRYKQHPWPLRTGHHEHTLSPPCHTQGQVSMDLGSTEGCEEEQRSQVTKGGSLRRDSLRNLEMRGHRGHEV